MAKSLHQLISDIRNAGDNVEKLQRDIPRIFGNESVKVIKENFKLEGYDSGTGVQKWAVRSPYTNKSYDKRHGVKGSVYQSGNPIMSQTLNLYNNTKYYLQSKAVVVGYDLTLVPYAKKMNDGGKGTWGKNNTDTPARPILSTDKPNIKILKRVLSKVEKERNNAMNLFKK